MRLDLQFYSDSIPWVFSMVVFFFASNLGSSNVHNKMVQLNTTKVFRATSGKTYCFETKSDNMIMILKMSVMVLDATFHNTHERGALVNVTKN